MVPSANSRCTIQQAADSLKVSTKTIRRYISQGLIQAERFGPRLIRVDLASLDRLGRPLQYVDRDGEPPGRSSIDLTSGGTTCAETSGETRAPRATVLLRPQGGVSE